MNPSETVGPSPGSAAPPAGTAATRDGLPDRILFLHANGFPTGVYRQFLAALGESATIVDLPIIDTPPDLPGRVRWQHMREQLRRLLQSHGDAGCALVGHSMGGYLALILAADALPVRHPVVMIDAPLVLGWRAGVFGFARRTGLSYRVGPAPVAGRRRDRWPDAETARRFFAGKPFVQRWAPGVLDDFVRHGLVPDRPGGELRLRIPRETERDIYANLAHRECARAMRRLQAAGRLPGFVGGQHSEELRMAGLPANRRLFGSRWRDVPAGHLIPMERPVDCAQAVLALLRQIGGIGNDGDDGVR